VPLHADIFISGFRLTGRIDAIYPERLIKYRYTRIKPKDRLNIWFQHLFLNSLVADHYPRISMLAGLSPKSKEPQWVAYEFPPVENSQEILENLVEKYWAGLVMPLHFFPRSSWEYAQLALDKEKPLEDALEKAHSTWNGNDFTSGEREDAYYQLCFGNTDPLDSEFQHIAEEVFGPLLEHQKEIEE
jgi:exodeoxyribonuclease V gamma subunit